MRFLLSFALVVMVTTNTFALRIVTYNTANSGDNDLPSLPRERMATVLQGIGDEVVNGASRPIDVLLLQEQDSITTTTQAIVDTLNELYGEGVYSRGRRGGRSNGGGRGAIVFNTQTVELVEEVSFGTLSGSAQSRETMRYTLRPVGYGEDANFVTYVNHYKAGTTTNDRRRREVEATALRRNADALATSLTRSEPHFIFAGDFNIQRCTEDMFGVLTSAGPAQAIDPVGSVAGCSWHDNSSVRRWHTQSPVDSNVEGFLARGGVDDRLDFQLVTEAMLDGEGLSLIPDTYRSFGNNGTHRLNQPINDIQNTGASRSVLNALARTSDHLPVVADYQIPAWMQVTTSQIPDRIIKNANVLVTVDIANVAPVQSVVEADELDFSALLEIDTSANFQAASGEVLATNLETITFPIPTDDVRSRVYRLRVDSDSESVVDGSFQTSGLYTVVGSAMPSWSESEQITDVTIDLGEVALDSRASATMSLFNLASPERTANLEFGNPQLASSMLRVLNQATGVVEPGESFSRLIEFEPNALGEFQSTVRLDVADDRTIFGASESVMEFTLVANVLLPGDANGDGRVQFDDFLALSSNFGETSVGWSDGDFDRDGSVLFADFLQLSNNFGIGTSVSTPEPTGWLSVACSLLFFGQLRQNRSCLKSLTYAYVRRT